MTNTFMEPGDAPQEDMIRSVDRGDCRELWRRPGGYYIWAVRVSASEAYLIEKGRLQHLSKEQH